MLRHTTRRSLQHAGSPVDRAHEKTISHSNCFVHSGCPELIVGAALGVKEGNMVLELIRRVRDKGLPVILISHNMPHVFEIADRIHVARLGKRAAVLNPKKISMSNTVALMTGASAPDQIPAECLAG